LDAQRASNRTAGIFSGHVRKDLEKCKKRQEKFIRETLGKCGRLCYPKSGVFLAVCFLDGGI
jgi:hypothetical protein